MRMKVCLDCIRMATNGASYGMGLETLCERRGGVLVGFLSRYNPHHTAPSECECIVFF